MEQHVTEATAQAEDAKMKGDALLAAVVSGGKVALGEQSQQIRDLVESNSQATETFKATIEAMNVTWAQRLEQEVVNNSRQKRS